MAEEKKRRDGVPSEGAGRKSTVDRRQEILMRRR
jgi:hypothetical protein